MGLQQNYFQISVPNLEIWAPNSEFGGQKLESFCYSPQTNNKITTKLCLAKSPIHFFEFRCCLGPKKLQRNINLEGFLTNNSFVVLLLLFGAFNKIPPNLGPDFLNTSRKPQVCCFGVLVPFSNWSKNTKLTPNCHRIIPKAHPFFVVFLGGLGAQKMKQTQTTTKLSQNYPKLSPKYIYWGLGRSFCRGGLGEHWDESGVLFGVCTGLWAD